MIALGCLGVLGACEGEQGEPRAEAEEPPRAVEHEGDPQVRGLRDAREVPAFAALGSVALVALGLGLAWPARPAPARPRRAGEWPGAASLAGAATLATLGVLAQLGASGLVHVLRGGACAAVLLALGVVGLHQAWSRPAAWLRVGFRVSLAALSVASAAQLVGTLTPALQPLALEASPAARWGQPAAWLAVALSCAALRPRAPAAERPLWAAARLVAVAGLTALLLPGGDAAPWPSDPHLRWLGQSLALWTALELALERPVRSLTLGVLSVLAPLSAVTASWWAPPPALEQGLALIAPALLLCVAARRVLFRVRARYWPEPAIDPRLNPLL